MRSFRDLYGAEPSFAAAARKVAYVKFSVVVARAGSEWLVAYHPREPEGAEPRATPAAGRTVWTEDNLAFAEYRALFEPQVSTDGGGS